jgi:hypothetical protein
MTTRLTRTQIGSGETGSKTDNGTQEGVRLEDYCIYSAGTALELQRSQAIQSSTSILTESCNCNLSEDLNPQVWLSHNTTASNLLIDESCVHARSAWNAWLRQDCHHVTVTSTLLTLRSSKLVLVVRLTGFIETVISP